MSIAISVADDFSASGWVRRFGSAVVRQLSNDAPPSETVSVKKIHHTETSLALRLQLGIEKYVIKAFNPCFKETPEALNREVHLLDLTQSTNLTPRLVAYSREHCFLIMRDVGEITLQDEVNPKTVVEIARRLGGWFRYFDMVAPVRTSSGDWNAYLQRTASHGLADLPDQTRKFLCELPIGKKKIAKNDAHLSNFLLNQQGEIIGIDFENATFKPVGWDILVTARILARSCPGQQLKIIDAIVDGWGKGTDELDTQAFHRLAQIFVQTTASHAT